MMLNRIVGVFLCPFLTTEGHKTSLKSVIFCFEHERIENNEKNFKHPRV